MKTFNSPTHFPWTRLIAALALLVSIRCLTGCAGSGELRSTSRSSASGGAFNDPAAAPESTSRSAAARRPGLGTEFGEERESGTRPVAFERSSDRDRPLATAAIYYDDRAGVRAQAGRPEDSRGFAQPPPQARGLIELKVVGENNFAIRTFTAGGRRYVVGTPGDRYAIAVRNRTDARLEVVLSVDGLDVLDGRRAAYSKPGYVLAPRGNLRVDGFRTSRSTVAAFRFASVQNSYANQSGQDTRNVGVIGAAVFGERGRLPFGQDDEETRRRRGADPFPGR